MELKIISKGKEYTCLYDEQDHELICKYKWHISDGYLRRSESVNGRTSGKKFHREIFNLTDSKLEVDHINHDKADNRRCNLRITTHRNNSKNRSSKKNATSKYLGVHLQKCNNKIYGTYQYFQARIRTDYELKYIGVFKNEEDAARAYDEAAKKYHGKFANLNFKTTI